MDPYENKNNENREMNEDENSSRSSSWYRDEQKPAEDGSYRIVKPDAERGDCCYRETRPRRRGNSCPLPGLRAARRRFRRTHRKQQPIRRGQRDG